MDARRLTEEDGEALWELRLHALRNNPEAFSGTYEETLVNGKERAFEVLRRQGENFYIGAFAASKLIGMVRFQREEGRKNRHKGHILSMYVQPENRNQGVGKVLLREAITQVKRIQGVEQLHLSVITKNEAAHSLYHTMGFEVYGTVPFALKEGEEYSDEYLMVLRF